MSEYSNHTIENDCHLKIELHIARDTCVNLSSLTVIKIITF